MPPEGLVMSDDPPVAPARATEATPSLGSALSLAIVTAALKDLLDNHLAQHSIMARVGDISVTALPPDRIPTGADERSGLNLFLYHVTPRARWCRPDGALSADSAEQVARPALVLDLHYLLAAYGQSDFHAETLLGYAMQVLMETPILTPQLIGRALETVAGGMPTDATDQAPLQKKIEVSPEFLSLEETTKLWSALQARYRPSAAYKVSSVVLQASR